MAITNGFKFGNYLQINTVYSRCQNYNGVEFLNMKICKVCMESDMLCGACNRRLESGETKRIEVDLSRVLHKFGKEKGFSIDFVSAVENNGKVFAVVESRHVSKFIGPGGRNIKKVSETLGRQIKLLEKAEGSEKHVIEKLIGAPVIGINKVYSGGEFYKVRIEKRYLKIVHPLAGIVGNVLGKKINFVFE